MDLMNFLCFGLTKAPAAFCNLLNDVLYDFLNKFIVVYLDDIIIYSDSLEELLLYLKLVFQRLRKKHKFCILKKKKKSVSFAGKRSLSLAM